MGICKKVLYLLNKFKDDEDVFKAAYSKEFREKSKKMPLKNEVDMEALLTEELRISINTEILANIIWLGKDDFLKDLREDKLKRILGED